MVLTAEPRGTDLNLAPGSGSHVHGPSALGVERLAAVPHYATSSLHLPWCQEEFAYPLLAPPVSAAAKDAIGSCAAAHTGSSGNGFSGFFGTGKGSTRRIQELLESCPAGRATASSEARALSERLLGFPQKPAQCDVDVLLPARKVIGLSRDWRWDDEEEHESKHLHEPCTRQGSTQFQVPARGPHSSKQADAGDRSSGTFSVPDELFGGARLDLRDTVSGPAQVWHSARSSLGLEADSNLWPGAVGVLAGLDESLQATLDRKEQKSFQEMPDSEDAIQAAKEREEETRKRAQTELARTLQLLRDLESSAQMPAAVPKQAPEGLRRRVTPKSGKERRDTAEDRTASQAALPESLQKASTPVPALGFSGSGFGAMPKGTPEDIQSTAVAGSSTATPGNSDSLRDVHRAVAPEGGWLQAAARHESAVQERATSSPGSAAFPAPVAPTAPQAPAAAQAAVSTATASSSMSPLENRARMLQIVEQAQTQLEPFKKNDAERKFRNETKKFVNTKVTQISANVQSVCKSVLALNDYANHAASQAGVNAVRQGAGGQDAQLFVELTVAYRLADEAEVGIRVKAQAAWPVAFVAASVFANYPRIGEIFEGFMHTNCPYLAPDYTGSNANRTSNCPGQREQEPYSQFVERMVGYMRLWLAIAVVRDDLAIVWQWLARTLNAPGEPAPIAATLMQCVFEMSASAALERYKQQFVKLMKYVESEYLPELESLQGRVSGEQADQLRASHARLRLWLEHFNQRKQAPEPEGRRIEVTAEAKLNPDV